MGIELPAELADIAQRTGTQWPKADEDAMREQATAWRDAAGQLRTLAGDADTSAGGALDAMTGDAGDAARRAWSGFVDQDKGSLSAAAKGADQAADRLDHAALQVADGKVEIVRQLVTAARNEDAARAAADGGHPTALLGLSNILGAASTNVASVTDSLVGSVADTALTLDPTEQVNPHPGSRGGGPPGNLLQAATGLVDTTAGTAGHVVDAGTRSVSGALEGTAGAVEATGETARGALESVAPDVDRAAGNVDRAAGNVDRAAAGEHFAAEVSPDASTPPSGLAVGGPGGGSFAEAVTPRSGVPIGPADVPARPLGSTSLAGFAEAPAPPAGQAPGAAPPLPGAAGGLAAGGPAGGAAAGGQPGFGPFGQAGGGAAPPPAQAPPAAPGGAAAGQPVRDDRAGQRQFGAYTDQRAERPEPRQPQQPAQQSQPPVGSPRQDRKSTVALFLVHMFPIGHLPKARSEPARQLPPPRVEADPAAALRFEPHDHPESHLLITDPADAATAPPDSAALPEDHPAVGKLLDLHDPLATMHERDWDRRYLVKQDEKSTEYAWPPGEVYPEGCYDDGEPVLLKPGELIDRFGDPHGRVFAAAGTPYHKRAVPPPDPASGYRRYRVVRELPMWRATSASWFGQPGGGIRYRGVYPARDLVMLGFLADVTAETEAPQAVPAQEQGGAG